MKISRLGLYWGLIEAPLVVFGLAESQFQSWNILDVSLLLFILISFYLGTRVGEMSEIGRAFSFSQPIPFVLGLIVSATVVPSDTLFSDTALVRFSLMFTGALVLVLFAVAGLFFALVGGFFGENFYERRNRTRLRPLTPLPKKDDETQKTA